MIVAAQTFEDSFLQHCQPTICTHNVFRPSGLKTLNSSTLADFRVLIRTFSGRMLAQVCEGVVQLGRLACLVSRCAGERVEVVSSNRASATRNYSAAIGSEHPATISIDSRPAATSRCHEPKTQSDAIDDFPQADLSSPIRPPIQRAARKFLSNS
jgi:hypothetical protein